MCLHHEAYVNEAANANDTHMSYSFRFCIVFKGIVYILLCV